MSAQASRRLAALVIVIVAPGCDNVEWGGASLRLQPPPPARIGGPPDTPRADAEPAEASMPEGPVLYMGRQDSAGVHLVPVGEILSDSIDAFPSEQDSPGYRARFVREVVPRGTEFVLFAEGTRVGSFTALSVDTDTTFCAPRPVLRGVAELTREASRVERFLALPREQGRTYEWDGLEPVETEREQRDATLELGADVIRQIGAEFPGRLLDTRWDMQAFRPEGEEATFFTVTYLLRDRLQIERPPPTAYSLFILGVPGDGGYEPGFVWYRDVSREGKGAPAFFESMDWDGDGQAEILLEILGERHRWTAALDRRRGRWTRVHEDPCGAAAPPVAASN